MSYFNTNGVSAGPIKINSTWIFNKYFTFKDHANKDYTSNYLTFALDQEGNNFSSLMAGSPVLSWKELKSGDEGYNPDAKVDVNGKQYLLQTPLDSVVTVRFLSAYTAIAPGDLTFNPNSFVTRAEFDALSNEVTINKSNIANNTANITQLNDRTTTLEAKMVDANSSIEWIKTSLINEWLSTGIIIQCGDVVQYSSEVI